MDNQAFADSGAGYSTPLGRPFYSEQTIGQRLKKAMVLLHHSFFCDTRVEYLTLLKIKCEAPAYGIELLKIVKIKRYSSLFLLHRTSPGKADVHIRDICYD